MTILCVCAILVLLVMTKTASPGISEIREAARAMLRLLDERAGRILDARFGITDGEPHTLQAVGDIEHLTRERIRQIEAGATTLLCAPRTVLPLTAARARTGLRELLVTLGGATLEQTLLDAVGGTDKRDRAALRFLLSSLPGVTEARETQRTSAHWTLADGVGGGGSPEAQTLEGILEAAERILQRAERVLPELEMLAGVRGETQTDLPADALKSLLGVGKLVVRTPFGEWGLRGWLETTPRSAGDKAYVVLKRAGKPLHFTAIAEEINRVGFDRKRIHPQTVHNELIRSTRFVLVGRGLYGLREKGYQPGTVADVLVRLLATAAHPVAKHELIDAALKQRFVKRSTVLLALQNRALFREAGKGMVERVTAATTGPRSGRGTGAVAEGDLEKTAMPPA